MGADRVYRFGAIDRIVTDPFEGLSIGRVFGPQRDNFNEEPAQPSDVAAAKQTSGAVFVVDAAVSESGLAATAAVAHVGGCAVPDASTGVLGGQWCTPADGGLAAIVAALLWLLRALLGGTCGQVRHATIFTDGKAVVDALVLGGGNRLQFLGEPKFWLASLALRLLGCRVEIRFLPRCSTADAVAPDALAKAALQQAGRPGGSRVLEVRESPRATKTATLALRRRELAAVTGSATVTARLVTRWSTQNYRDTLWRLCEKSAFHTRRETRRRSSPKPATSRQEKHLWGDTRHFLGENLPHHAIFWGRNICT